MSGKAPRQADPVRKVMLPDWFREEDQLRRILLMRRDGAKVHAILETCGLTRASWSRARQAAGGQARYQAEELVAKAFFGRFDGFHRTVRSGPALFTEREAQALAKSIAGWKLNGVSCLPHTPDEEGGK